MLLFDLKWFIFIILIVISFIVMLIIWGISIYQKRTNNLFVQHGSTLLPILEQVPFGWLIIDNHRQYHYANTYTRHHLALDAPLGTLPDEVWVTLLLEDCSGMAPLNDTTGRYRRFVLPSTQIIQWWIFPLNHLNVAFIFNVTDQYRAKEASQQLLSNLSHELRTPLASILTHLEILSMPHIPLETTQQSLQLLKQEGQRMSWLINQMLDLGRIQTEEGLARRYLDILLIAQEAVTQVLPLAKAKKTDIVIEADTPLPPIIGDDNRLKQVFLNLLDNAIKHTPDSTKITLSLQQEAKGIRCTVSDNGPGIPAEHMPYITHRFYRAAPQKVEGSGLGLALIVEILERHQSHLTIENQTQGYNTGIQACFTLPFPPES